MRISNILLSCVLPLVLSGEIVDSVVAIVGFQPIKHSDVVRDLRTTAFLNQTPLDLAPERQQEAVNRLVDQAIIRVELEDGAYPEVASDRVEQLLAQVRRRYSSVAEFERQLGSLGLTEAVLRSQLAWQLRVLDFTEARFGQLAENAAPEEDEFIRWLETARGRQRVIIRAERLQ